MIHNETMQRATCDGCGKVRVGDEHAVLPGFHLNAMEVDPQGRCRATDLYACTSRCAGKTIMLALRALPWLDDAMGAVAGSSDTESADSPNGAPASAGLPQFSQHADEHHTPR